MIGVAWFTVASAACARRHRLGPADRHPPVAGRGRGAARRPGSLAILEASFARDDRSEAIGAWSGLGGVATAAGPLLGGYLITAASWRWIFLINVPLGGVVLLLSARHVPESHDPDIDGPVDVAGAALATVALATLAYGLIEGPTDGWGSGDGDRLPGHRRAGLPSPSASSSTGRRSRCCPSASSAAGSSR